LQLGAWAAQEKNLIKWSAIACRKNAAKIVFIYIDIVRERGIQLHWAKTPSLCALVLSAAGDRLAPPLSLGQVNFLAPFVFCLLMNLISNCARHEDFCTARMINYKHGLVLVLFQVWNF